MLKLRKPLLLKALAGGSLLSLAALPVALATPRQEAANKIIFDGKVYDSMEKAAQAYLQSRRNNISALTVVGDVNKAVFDAKYSILNRNELFDYNPTRISPAYVTRTGSLVSRPETAAATFATPTNSTARYTFPGAQVYYETEAEAKNAQINSAFLQSIALAKVNDPGDLRAVPSVLYLNATNAGDLDLLEQTVLKALTNNGQAALRETEVSYQNTLVPKALGRDWAIKNFYGEITPGAKLQLIDDIPGAHQGPALDFSKWSVQKQWLAAALPTGFLDSNPVFSANGVTYDLRGERPRVSVVFNVNLLDPTGKPTVWQGVRVKYNNSGGRGNDVYSGTTIFNPVETGFGFGTTNNVVAYDFKFTNDQTPGPTLNPTLNDLPKEVQGTMANDDSSLPFYLTTLTTGNSGTKRFGLDGIIARAYGRVPVAGYYERTHGEGTTDITSTVYANLAKALNTFLDGAKSGPNTNVSLPKLLGANLQGYAQAANLQLELATLNPAYGIAFSFKQAALDYKQHRADEGWYKGEDVYFSYYDVWEALQLRNLRSEFEFNTLFNPQLSGDALYQVRLDLSAQAKRLHRVVTYQGQPLFAVTINTDNTISLQRLAQSRIVGGELTILNGPSQNALLAEIITALDNATTTPEKVRTLLANKTLVQNTIDVLRQQRRSRQQPFRAPSAAAAPYAQYVAEMRAYLTKLQLIGNEASLYKVFAAHFLPISQYLNLGAIEYYANRVYRDNYNPATYGNEINSELIDLGQNESEYQLALTQSARGQGQIARVSVFYDGEGKEITPPLHTSPFDNAIFDDKEFVYDSIKRTYPLTISREYLFIRDKLNKEHQVVAQIHTIYEFIEANEPTYFRTFDALWSYIKDLVARAATKLG